MKQTEFKIKSNEPLAKDMFLMRLTGDTSDIRPGQFVNIQINSLYLRRPISVCDLDGDVLTIIYKVVGKGTEIMSQMTPGTPLDTLTGLGNGYDLTKSSARPLLVGGGVGVPPLYYAAKKLAENGIKPAAVLGFTSSADVFYENEFKEYCTDVVITTNDGSAGIRGFVTDGIKRLAENNNKFTFFYTCGPEPMLKAVYRCPELESVEGEFSFEERMGCGFGACMGCSCKTVTGYKRICKDGPILEKNEILWEDV